jgi:hypothetical protein
MPRSRRVKTATTLFVLFAVLCTPVVPAANAGLLNNLFGGSGSNPAPSSTPTSAPTSEPAPYPPSGPVTPSNFRIGWYDYLFQPAHPAMIAAGGMSMITAYNDKDVQPEPYLAAAQDAGMPVKLEVPEELVKAVDVEGVKAFVARYKDHPAVEGWHLADEPSVNYTLGPLSAANAIKLHDAIKSVDPVQPISMTFASGEDARPYLPSFDVLQHDHYPAKAWGREFAGMADWKRFTYWMSYVARENNKPFYPILQAFGGTNLKPVMGYRAPTSREMRYMVYGSLTALSKSVYFWSFYRRDPNWVSSTLQPIVDHLRTMQPALNGGAVSGVVSSTNPAIHATAYKDPSTGRWYVVTVNHSSGSSPGYLKFSGELAGKDVAYRPGTATPITNNQLSHTLALYEARIYTIG